MAVMMALVAVTMPGARNRQTILIANNTNMNAYKKMIIIMRSAYVLTGDWEIRPLADGRECGSKPWPTPLPS
jgi:hypothetical protein